MRGSLLVLSHSKYTTHGLLPVAGLCNLQLELFTEVVTPELGPAGALLPQAALQNRALLALKPEVRRRAGSGS